jgi:hypothetical protein
MLISHSLASFDDLVGYLKDQSQATKSLLDFFKSSNSAFMHLSKNLEISIQHLDSHASKFKLNDSLTSAIQTMKNNLIPMVQVLNNVCKTISRDAIRPTEKAILRYNDMESTIIQSGFWNISEYNQLISKIKRHRSIYYNTSEILETSTEADFQRALENVKRSEEEKKRYRKSVEKMKAWKEGNAEKFEGILKVLSEYESSRRHVIKDALTTYQYESLYYYQEMLENIKAMRFERISVEDDLQILKSYFDALESSKDSNEFVSYEELKNEVTLGECQKSEEAETMLEDEMDSERLARLLNKLFEEGKDSIYDSINSSSPSDMLIETLNSSQGRRDFCEIVEQYPKSELSFSNIEILSDLITFLLNSATRDNDMDPSLFYKIIKICAKFYYIKEGLKVPISMMVSKHSIWRDTSIWFNTIQSLVKSKPTDLEIPAVPTTPTGKISKAFSNMMKTFKKKKESDSSGISWPLVSGIFDEFYTSMVSLNIPDKIARQILMNINAKLGLETNFIDILPISYRNWYRIEGCKKARLVMKWGNLNWMRGVVEYLDEEDLRRGMVVCKDWYRYLHRIACCMYGQRLKQYNNPEIRKQLWQIALDTKNEKVSYEEYLSKFVENIEKYKKFDNQISLDVRRSFQDNLNLSSSQLTSILRAYVALNPELGYCQGMNYLAGTFFVVLQDETSTLRSLSALISKFTLRPLYLQENHMRELFFYQLDRLIQLYLPSVHASFYIAGVWPRLYSIPWFLTLFSGSFKKQESLVSKLWDMILLKGWKVVFKTSLVILDNLAHHLIGRDFDEIMSVLSEMTRNERYSYIFTENLLRGLDSFKVTNRMLEYLKEEFRSNHIDTSNRFIF